MLPHGDSFMKYRDCGRIAHAVDSAHRLRIEATPWIGKMVASLPGALCNKGPGSLELTSGFSFTESGKVGVVE